MTTALQIIFTALAVSLDSFVAGFGVALGKRSNWATPSIVAIITTVMCATACAVATLAKQYLANANYFGATALLALALINIFKQNETKMRLGQISAKESCAVGLSVGTDAAVASLTFTFANAVAIVPLAFGVMHFVAVALGQKLAKQCTVTNTNLLCFALFLCLALIKFFD